MWSRDAHFYTWTFILSTKQEFEHMSDFTKLQTEFVINEGTDEEMTAIIPHWSPSKTYTRLPKIGRYFAVPLSMIITSGEEGLEEALPSALLYLFDEMEEKDVNKLFSFILEGVVCKKMGQNDIDVSITENSDKVFMYDPAGLLELVAKALEVHYAPLFKKGGFAGLFKIMANLNSANTQLQQD